jgi:cytochrome c oxidase subunit 2
MSFKQFSRRFGALAGGGLLMNSSSAWAELGLNMTRGVTSISRAAYDLHMLIFWICVLIGLVVFGVMFYSMYHHRKSKGVVPAQFHESTTVEIVWTVVPMLILIGMAVPATRALIAMEDTSNADMTITVTGYQWKWKYDYLDEGVSFFSTSSTPRAQIVNDQEKGENYLLEVDNPVVVPVGKKIRFLTTAADVIHAWWVPDLGWKRDAIPGFINESWATIEEPGIYRGQCAELCGKDHGFMPVVVVAKTEEDYQAWLSEQKASAGAAAASADREWTLEELMSKGESVYGTACAACHLPTGEGMGDMFPALKGSPVTTAGPVEEHIATVLKGRTGTAMAAFATQLDDVDLAAVVTYTRNAWGNDTGQLVQPSQIESLR